MKLPIPFDDPATYPGHSGVDFAQPRGTRFRASGDGAVTLRRTTPAGGNMIWVEYDALPTGAGVGYAHMDSWTDCPTVGTRVTEGTVLGRVGSSGHSTGPHLHVEVAGHATTAGFWEFFDPIRVISPLPTTAASSPHPITEEPDMDATQSKQLTEIHQAIFARKSDGPGSWDGIDQKLGILVAQLGEIRQAIFARKSDGPGSWDGIDQKLGILVAQVDAMRSASR
ncbi:M23 family metallopeptidase [Microbacterium sp. ASV49]|uniref:M23 family metallopeptidase n=1 Tax=Microbacterium candidum TaxID=3041922 RepID=A0ABT7MWN8_9MICO|nr:M23 family metallopeptidase [Microbacterium sp. ASV49]MDL9978854.1 M23 family metallopeptidase [Microbacterium sp. ASV49]